MNVCVVDEQTNELIAYISDEHDSIFKDGYKIINYGNNEPIFNSDNEKVYVKENAFTINSLRGNENESKSDNI